jgi:hypothetical protein
MSSSHPKSCKRSKSLPFSEIETTATQSYHMYGGVIPFQYEHHGVLKGLVYVLRLQVLPAARVWAQATSRL